ncbi:16S rRNA (guanine(527)-N(7))-methyltransferase RsmG [Sessilibacter corallicola]|uniref:Ribosomal RNA small subunit methyltransferase G n=1 Tax=Sessilibacter corallicola TaxID=2904075 RepID=A0ABQ0ABI4_9GAMM
MSAFDPHKFLTARLKRLGVQCTAHQIEQLVSYAQLFHKWNKAYNLSAIRDLPSIIDRHIVDSLSVLNLLPDLCDYRMIDVGTGGGLPGIPLAIMRPSWQLSLLDSNGKKTRFLVQVKLELELANVEIHNCRVESHVPERPYQGVISRAFASLEDMINYCKHLVDDSGVFWAMKGQFPTTEIDALPDGYTVQHCRSIEVPDEDGERHLLAIVKG